MYIKENFSFHKDDADKFPSLNVPCRDYYDYYNYSVIKQDFEGKSSTAKYRNIILSEKEIKYSKYIIKDNVFYYKNEDFIYSSNRLGMSADEYYGEYKNIILDLEKKYFLAKKEQAEKRKIALERKEKEEILENINDYIKNIPQKIEKYKDDLEFITKVTEIYSNSLNEITKKPGLLSKFKIGK